MVKIKITKCKCGKNFEYPSWKNRIYCSHKCYCKYRSPHKALFKKGMTPWNKGVKGKQVSYRKGKTWESIWGKTDANKMKMNLRKKKYKGSVSINKDGYLRQRSPTTGKHILVHQKVWKDNNIGYIPSGCCVHHLDRNKLNNDPDNLLLLDFATHSKLHHTGMKHSEESKKKMSISQQIRRNK